jgi:hypothetical protein
MEFTTPVPAPRDVQSSSMLVRGGVALRLLKRYALAGVTGHGW